MLSRLRRLQASVGAACHSELIHRYICQHCRACEECNTVIALLPVLCLSICYMDVIDMAKYYQNFAVDISIFSTLNAVTMEWAQEQSVSRQTPNIRLGTLVLIK